LATRNPALDGRSPTRFRSFRLACFSGLVLAAASGCAVGPTFKRPEARVPAGWSSPSSSPAESADTMLASWWAGFNDPVLTSLVQRAIESNLDLKLAESRVRQARAARRVSISSLGPTADVSSSARRSQSSSGGSNGDAQHSISDQYAANFDASWELDVFGGVRRDVEAAGADYRAAVESRRDVFVTLTAEVARNYVDLRTLQMRIAVAQSNLDAQKHTTDLTRQRFDVGFVSGLDVARAEAQVASTASQIPTLEASARQTIHNISVLLGDEPEALAGELTERFDIPTPLSSVPTGLPSELLRRRPDIRRAEAEAHAATARVGVATADLFPKFNISGSAGYVARQVSSWFNPGNLIWSLGSSLVWNVFNTGRTRANIEIKKALEEQSVIAYRQTVLVALQEVEDALITSSKEEQRYALLEEAVTANRKAVRIASALYSEGQTDFLSVLDAQRSLYVAEEAAAQSRGTQAKNQIALYKALGGGWEAGELNDVRAAGAATAAAMLP